VTASAGCHGKEAIKYVSQFGDNMMADDTLIANIPVIYYNLLDAKSPMVVLFS